MKISTGIGLRLSPFDSVDDALHTESPESETHRLTLLSRRASGRIGDTRAGLAGDVPGVVDTPDRFGGLTIAELEGPTPPEAPFFVGVLNAGLGMLKLGIVGERSEKDVLVGDCDERQPVLNAKRPRQPLARCSANDSASVEALQRERSTLSGCAENRSSCGRTDGLSGIAMPWNSWSSSPMKKAEPAGVAGSSGIASRESSESMAMRGMDACEYRLGEVLLGVGGRLSSSSSDSGTHSSSRAPRSTSSMSAAQNSADAGLSPTSATSEMSAGTKRGNGRATVGVDTTKLQLCGVVLMGVTGFEMHESRDGPAGTAREMVVVAALASSAKSSSVFSSMVGEGLDTGDGGAMKTSVPLSTSMMRMGGGGGGRFGI